MIPLCKSYIEAIFYSDLGLNEKINLLWDTLSFFENCNKDYVPLSKGIETETIRYFINSLSEKCWPSIPESTSDNLTDLLFYGRIPTITKAMFLIENRTIDITEFIVSCLNHIHIGSGKKELDFSKLQFLDAIKEYVQQKDQTVYNANEGSVYLQIFSNLGIKNLTIPMKHKMQFHSLRHILSNQSRRILIQN